MRLDRVKLIAEMARKDVTAGALAAACGTSRSTISGIRQGRSCSTDTAEKIAKALNVSIDELLENAI